MEDFEINFDDFEMEVTPMGDDKAPDLKKVTKKEVKETNEDTRSQVYDEELIEIPDYEETNEEDIDEKAPPVKQAESSSSPKSNVWVSFAKVMSEEGLLSSFNEEDFEQMVEEHGSPASAIIAMADKTIKETIDEHINSQDAAYKEFVKFRDFGVDMGKYAEITKGSKAFDSVTVENLEDDESLQEQVVKQDLINKGISIEDIEDTIEAFKDTGKLVKKAETALGNIKKFKERQIAKLEEDAVKTREEGARQYKAQKESLKDMIESTSEIVPGVKMNKQTKDKLFNMIISPHSTTEDGKQINAITAKRMENPLKYAMIEAALVNMGVFDGKWDSIIKGSKTRAIDELEKKVNSGVDFKNKSGKTGGEYIKTLLSNIPD